MAFNILESKSELTTELGRYTSQNSNLFGKEAIMSKLNFYRKKKINIVGWYGKHNVGDEAFKVVFEKFFDGYSLQFFTPPQQCPNGDHTILGGGAVASPFYLNTLPTGKKLAIGIDLAYESEADLLAKQEFKSIYVRTKTDCEALKPKVKCPVYQIPDLAFYLQKSNQSPMQKYKKFKNKKTVAVLVTDYVNPAIDRHYENYAQRAWEFKVKLAHELDVLAGEGFEILLLPCSTGGYGDDRRINLDLAAFMKYEPTNILEEINPQAMIDLIAECEFTICQRFHAHIFSIIAGVPFVSIEFTRKVKLLLEENQLLDWTGGLYENKSTFDFSKVQAVWKGFKATDSRKLSDLSKDNFDKLNLIKSQVLGEIFG